MKLLKLFAVGACAMLFTACVESSAEYHQTYFYPADAYGTTLYADQTLDSVFVRSMDSWTAETECENGWFSVTPTVFVINTEAVLVQQKMEIHAHANNTGSIREGLIKLNTFTTLGRKVAQLPWLDITVPESRYIGENNMLADSVMFDLYVSAAATDTMLNFRTYAENAELSGFGDWVVADVVQYPEQGRHKPMLKISANPSVASRIDTLQLTSNGVTSLICIKQAGKSVEKP